VIICASCGRENPADARFCKDCGDELATVQTQREVRKTVTVVFSDVTGSTALGHCAWGSAGVRRAPGRAVAAQHRDLNQAV